MADPFASAKPDACAITPAAIRVDAVSHLVAHAVASLREGVHSALVIINILARRRNPDPPPLLLTPTVLRLTHEPMADCARYDRLRGQADMDRT